MRKTTVFKKTKSRICKLGTASIKIVQTTLMLIHDQLVPLKDLKPLSQQELDDVREWAFREHLHAGDNNLRRWPVPMWFEDWKEKNKDKLRASLTVN